MVLLSFESSKLISVKKTIKKSLEASNFIIATGARARVIDGMAPDEI